MMESTDGSTVSAAGPSGMYVSSPTTRRILIGRSQPSMTAVKIASLMPPLGNTP